MELRLHDIQDCVTVLGPGVRYAIWTQGCLRRCPNCMTPESRNTDGGYRMDTAVLSEKILKADREGITISGGEPFLQAKALAELILRLREKRDIGVIVYTGNTIEELRAMQDEHVNLLLSLCDLLIDGEYIDERNDGKALRGSSNQRVIALSDRYVNYLSEYGTSPAKVEFFLRENRLSMVGIPSREMLSRFRNRSF